MGFRPSFVFLALAALPLRAQTAPAASPCANTPSYSPCEIVFELPPPDAAAHPHPYETVDLTVEFRSPRQHTYTLPAFWDGAGRMVVRFSPVEAGAWDYLVKSNIAAWNGQIGHFTTAPSDSRGFIHPAALHHWAYTERANGLDQPHLWMGVTEPRFAFLDDAAARSLADARAAEKFTHLRVPLAGEGSDPFLFQGPDVPNLAFFQRLDQRLRYLNQKGIVADIVLARQPAGLLKVLPTPDQRRRFVRYVAGRYAAMNVTWQAVDQFEGDLDSRFLLREFGAALKQADPYQHPRTAGARLTSAPLLDDGWMDFVANGSADDDLGAVEHQLHPVPFVNIDAPPPGADPAAVRHRLWNAAMDGQSVTYAFAGPAAKAMTVWFDVLSGTRYWELEPYFDIDNGRALALEDVEYLIYIEKPGPIELIVANHAYDVFWINPADGETIRKKFSGDHFTAEPPDRSHDWVLHVVRLSHLESMNKSYKFESREDPIGLQEIEANTPKVPFTIEQPAGDLSISQPAPYSAKLTHETRATRTMRFVWLGDVATDGQGFRVLATGQKGTFRFPPDLAATYPAVMHLRLYGMNANGKVYEVDTACGLKP